VTSQASQGSIDQDPRQAVRQLTLAALEAVHSMLAWRRLPFFRCCHTGDPDQCPSAGVNWIPMFDFT
jgi:hypothetical protein